MGGSRRCPMCDSSAVVPIVYGLPSIGLEEAEARGEVEIGGCVVMGDGHQPRWSCTSCAHRWLTTSTLGPASAEAEDPLDG
jgi:hypothetical protein